MKWTIAAAACLLAGLPSAPAGQIFRAATEAVRMDVLVTNGNRPVGGLKREDFEILDNGVAQSVAGVTIEEIPFSMLLALDTSGSMEGDALDDLKAAATAAVNAMRAGDRAAILTFSEQLEKPAGWLPKGPALLEAIGGVRAAGATALYDAGFAALSIRDAEPGRRALVLLFSDGEDTTSWLPGAAAMDKAGRTEAVVYTVVLGPDRGHSAADADSAVTPRARPALAAPTIDSRARRHLFFRSGVRLSPGAPLIEQSPFLADLAERTGGEALTADTGGKLRDAFERIVMDFRSRYLLTYFPKGVDTPGWHRLEVKVKNRAGKVRARRGYER